MKYDDAKSQERQFKLEQTKVKTTARHLIFELDHVDLTVSTKEENFIRMVDCMAKLEEQEDVAGALGTMASTYLQKTALSHYSELRMYMIQGSF